MQAIGGCTTKAAREVTTLTDANLEHANVAFRAQAAGLLPAAALAQRIGLGDLVDRRLRLAAEGANSGSKALTVIGSMLAGGDSAAWTPIPS